MTRFASKLWLSRHMLTDRFQWYNPPIVQSDPELRHQTNKFTGPNPLVPGATAFEDLRIDQSARDKSLLSASANATRPPHTLVPGKAPDLLSTTMPCCREMYPFIWPWTAISK
jgi:hypothetical protein